MVTRPHSEIMAPINKHARNTYGLLGLLLLLYGAGMATIYRVQKRKAVLEAETENLKRIAETSEALQDSEERFRGLFENLPVAIWESDFSDVKTYVDDLRSTGVRDIRTYFDEHPEAFADCVTMVKIVDVNRAALELYKAKTKEELFTDFGKVLTEESYDMMREDIISLAKGEAIFESSSIAQDMDGRRIDIIIRRTVAPGHENTWSRLFVPAIDITEYKRMEEELQKVQKLESVGVLAGGIAHDFNNLLTGIMGNISLVEMYAGTGRQMEKVLERLTEAERSSMRAASLAQQLLTFSSGGAPIRKTASIAKLLRDSTTLASSGTNIRCEFSIPDDLWSVEMDEGQMDQVISNIIINAGQAMASGGTVKVNAGNITVTAEYGLPLEDGEYVEISIEDHGIGILEVDLPRIFDPYFTTKQTGRGLGLAICYSILEKHGGYITAESQIGVGTAFHIYLPASPEEVSVKEEIREEKPIMGK